MALAAGLAEVGAGLLLAIGLLTPVVALAVAVVMLTAVGAVLSRRRFTNGSRGGQHGVVTWAVAVALAATGGADFSVDALIGWGDELRDAWWGLLVLVGGGLLSVATAPDGRPQRSLGRAPGSDEPALRKAA
jgi:hypothetical protein